MTIKQCRSCRWYHIWKKEIKETCFYQQKAFMSSKSCDWYLQGNFEEVREHYRRKFNHELP